MNILDIKMRLLDVIEEKENLAIELKTKNSTEGIRRYRALDKEKDELIDMLAGGQVKNDTQFSLGGCLIGIQEDIKGIKKSVAILQKQTENRVINFGGLTVTCGVDGKDLAEAINSYADKKEATPEVSAQKQLEENFSPYTGEKLHDVCPNCWVKGNKPYNCGYDKCPGYKLFKLEKSKS